MSGLPWFRMYTEFLNDSKIISLAFEDQRHYIGLLALKCDGVLDQYCDEGIMNRIVAQRLWLDFASITDVKKRLIDAELIDENWQPIAWEKRQRKSDHDLSGAERQKRWRERQKAENAGKNNRNTLRNATVTPPDKIREDKKRVTNRFSPPSKDELQAYAKEKNLNLSGFMDYYNSNGWMVGKNKMKCWKSAASGWSRRQSSFGNTTEVKTSKRRAI